MTSPRRTRSQLALPAFDLNQLARSPLKDARQALRNNQSPQSNPLAEAGPHLFSPLRKQHKRSSSPFKDTNAYERDYKRAKHDDGREENCSPLLRPRRPPSASSIREATAQSHTPPNFRRAQSVPAWPSTPLIDLTRVSRSPSKASPILHIATLPSELTHPNQPIGQEPSAPLAFDHASLVLAHPCTPDQPTSPPISPLSPLTPLTDAAGIPSDAVQSSDDVEVTRGAPKQLSFLPINDDAATPRPVLPVSMVATPSAGFSRLPRLSLVPSSRPPSSNIEQTKQSRAPSKRPDKSRARLGPIPLGGRMTRSAALRQKESMRRDAEAAITLTAGASSQATPVSLRFTPAKPVAAAADVSNKPTLSGLRKRRSFTFSFAQPTASSVAKSIPSSPEKGKERERPRSGLPVAPTSTSSSNVVQTPTDTERSPLNSSLSSLSLALQKLNMPAPSRPSTSMGFHPGPAGTSDRPPVAESAHPRPPAFGPSHPRPNSVIAGPVRATSLQRANTVADFFRTPAQPRQTMLTPTAAMRAKTPDAKKRINIHSGIVVGKPKGNIAFGTPSSSNAPGPAAAPSSSSSWSVLTPSTSRHPEASSGGTAAGFKGRRIFPRASKKSSLPMVEGSPVKGGGAESSGAGEAEEAINKVGASIIAQAVEREQDADKSVCAEASETGEDSSMPAPPPRAGADEPPAPEYANASAAVAQTLKRDPTRRASLALQLVREAHSTQPPQTPIASSSKEQGNPSTASPALAKRHTPATGAFRAPPTSFHPFNLRERPEPKSAPSVLKRSASGAHVSGKRGSGEGSGSGNGTPSKMSGVLRDCTVFVDVRTDDGDDAGALFVDMLADMGAKVLTRVGQTCTHVIFKNGLLSTLTRYRLLKEPRPLVVGIAWVVECAEQCTRVDEGKFVISLDGVNVAGTQKVSTTVHASPAILNATISRGGCSRHLPTRCHQSEVQLCTPGGQPVRDAGCPAFFFTIGC
ncbi:hypothetical protein EVJ58_g8458 [Rhodofomes roseus]|uniref:BRCT domain-containing protein n=1 Tax=Rhodofomes roseus TaxID=34475 RepID=A0A4Y9XXW9_9APHY|nr:hypothetical protein EVJ58_g8458 [Rhodofomes roseus]